MVPHTDDFFFNSYNILYFSIRAVDQNIIKRTLCLKNIVKFVLPISNSIKIFTYVNKKNFTFSIDSVLFYL